LDKYIAVEYSDITPQEMHASCVGTKACSKVAMTGGWTRTNQQLNIFQQFMPFIGAMILSHHPSNEEFPSLASFRNGSGTINCSGIEGHLGEYIPLSAHKKPEIFNKESRQLRLRKVLTRIGYIAGYISPKYIHAST
jgi:hypothetical protein